MKEAAGEANMTVITIVLIGIVLAVGTVVVNSMMANTKKRSECSNEGGAWYKGSCCVAPVVNSSGKITSCQEYVSIKD